MSESRLVPWLVGDRLVATHHTELMGIVNVTPDSFFDGGQHNTVERAIAHALQLVAEGASIIDVGGESTRPGAAPVDETQECERVLPVLKALAPHCPQRGFLLSIDTRHAEVADQALNAGASIVNDVSALADPAMADVILKHSASVVLNHMRGTPDTMQTDPQYQDVLREVVQELLQPALHLIRLGLDPRRICLDPGIGFGKRHSDNIALIAHAQDLMVLSDSMAGNVFPWLYGMSRKSFIGRVEGLEQSDRLIPSLVCAAVVAKNGVGLLRVHDVAATREALAMARALLL